LRKNTQERSERSKKDKSASAPTSVLGQSNACADYTKTMLNNMCVVSRGKERYRICFSLSGELSSFFIRASSSEIAVVIIMLST
jgi:hypothetical protein